MTLDAGLAAPAVAGLAAYLMSLDEYRAQLLVPGSVGRNVRDLIKSLAYARLPLQPAVVWNGIDLRQIQCAVRRDAGSSGCPARNTTVSIAPPTVTTNSHPSSSIATRPSTLTSSSSWNSKLPSSSITKSFITTLNKTPTTSLDLGVKVFSSSVA